MKSVLLLLLGCFSNLAVAIQESDLTLIHVQPVWRHGDRSPTKTYPADPYQEDAWTFGGSGWGQLSPTGMMQHMRLGQSARKRYITDVYPGYLSKFYDSHEIYVRSTDVNRTIISALSNMIGMYGQPSYNNRVGQDLPTSGNGSNGEPIWPPGYVPIAIHTVDDDTDYIGNADATCKRQTQLWEMAKTSPELQAFINSNETQYVLTSLTPHSNWTVDIDNLWISTDAFFIEKQNFPTDFPKKVPWLSDDLYKRSRTVNDQVQEYQNGCFNKPVIMNGLDIGVEIQKIRGGSLTNDILYHANIKLACYRKNDTTSNDCKWIGKNKYYVYSAHDTTLYAYFSCLGIENKIKTLPYGYPLYSAAVIFELWYDSKADAAYFRLLYHDADGDMKLEVITPDVDGCDSEFCPLEKYAQKAKTVKPDMDMSLWCNVDPTIAPPSPKSATLLSSFTGILFTLLLALRS